MAAKESRAVKVREVKSVSDIGGSARTAPAAMATCGGGGVWMCVCVRECVCPHPHPPQHTNNNTTNGVETWSTYRTVGVPRVLSVGPMLEHRVRHVGHDDKTPDANKVAVKGNCDAHGDAGLVAEHLANDFLKGFAVHVGRAAHNGVCRAAHDDCVCDKRGQPHGGTHHLERVGQRQNAGTHGAVENGEGGAEEATAAFFLRIDLRLEGGRVGEQRSADVVDFVVLNVVVTRGVYRMVFARHATRRRVGVLGCWPGHATRGEANTRGAHETTNGCVSFF